MEFLLLQARTLAKALRLLQVDLDRETSEIARGYLREALLRTQGNAVEVIALLSEGEFRLLDDPDDIAGDLLRALSASGVQNAHKRVELERLYRVLIPRRPSIRGGYTLLRLQLDYFGVGQGLFAAGQIELAHGHHDTTLSWVFDCGTSSRQALLIEPLHKLEESVANRRGSSLGVVVLSHFDCDHISGIAELVKRFRIDVLLLPYLSIAERLVAALDEEVSPQDPLFAAFLDPVAFLIAMAGDRGIGRFIFVRGNSGDLIPSDSEPSPSLPISDSPLETTPPLRADSGLASQDDLTELAVQVDGTAVEVLRPDGRVTLQGVWEFVPYNDDDLAVRAHPMFVSRARILAQAIREHPANAPTCLVELRDLYDRTFGKSSQRRNLISLMLFSGGLGARQASTRVSHYIVSNLDRASFQRRLLWTDGRHATLYTGDAFLNSSRRLEKLVSALGSARLSSLLCLQVMHHGAEKNWCPAVTQSLKPLVSIFSAEPRDQRYCHPDAAVVKAFMEFQPVLVDSTTSATFDIDLFE